MLDNRSCKSDSISSDLPYDSLPLLFSGSMLGTILLNISRAYQGVRHTLGCYLEQIEANELQ